MLEVGSRVKCKSEMFNGTSTVVYIDYIAIHVPHFYPIQVELNGPDQDGHKIKCYKADYFYDVDTGEPVESSKVVYLGKDGVYYL